MTAKQSKRARHEAARRAKQRRQRMIWIVAVLAVVVGLGAFVTVRNGSTDEAAALAPNFELANLDGETVKLSDYLGQPVAVTFMHSW